MATAKFYFPAESLGDALFDNLETAELLSYSSSEMRLGVPGGPTLVVLSGRFNFTSAGELTRGTLTGLTAYRANGVSKDAVLGGLNVDLRTLVDVAISGTEDEIGNLLFGGADRFTGSSGADDLPSYNGNDTIDGGAGKDTMTGGNGSDTYFVRDVGDLVIETNSSVSSGGTDNVLSYLSSCTLPRNVENGRIMTSAGGKLVGNGLANSLTGGSGADTLVGGAGNDKLTGGDGGDTADYAGASSAVTVNLSVTSAQVTGGAGTDTLSSIERLTGSSFADRLSGSGGANRLAGGGGNDKLDGGAGNDSLSGGSGNDTLSGGSGADSMTGGAGRDIFRFSSALNGSTNVDTVLDFNVTDDTLQLENIIFTKLATAGVLSASFFRANTSGSAGDRNDYVLYETDTGKLFYDADGSGAGAKVLVAMLTTHPALTAADIFVI